MNDSTVKAVRSAAVAGWWTVLIFAVVLTLQWLGVLVLLHYQPGWLLTLWGGGDLEWHDVHMICLQVMGIWKVLLWLELSVTVWLTLWARRLRRAV